MGDLHVDATNSPPVVSPEEMAGRFHGELIGVMPDWKRRLGEDPSRLSELEQEVRDAFSRGADLVVAGLIARVMKQPCSPALESRVSRQAALNPSLQFAQEELARDGLKMDVKTIARITYQCGAGMLALRTYELMQWRLGNLCRYDTSTNTQCTKTTAK